jgi:hypothetical protein
MTEQSLNRGITLALAVELGKRPAPLLAAHTLEDWLYESMSGA